MRKLVLVAAVAALTWPYCASAREFSTSGDYHGGSDIGPLGQCFNPPDCGRHKDTNGDYGRGTRGSGCGVLADGRVTDRRHGS